MFGPFDWTPPQNPGAEPWPGECACKVVDKRPGPELALCEWVTWQNWGGDPAAAQTHVRAALTFQVGGYKGPVSDRARALAIKERDARCAP